MNPDQANWQEEGGQHRTSLDIACDPDGTIRLKSGSFEYEGTDRDEAMQSFASLLGYGQEQSSQGQQ